MNAVTHVAMLPAGPNWPSRLLLGVIRAYQLLLSPLLGQACRFEPTCSRYAATCIERFGALRGTWLGTKRICRCHPWHQGGFDPPPAAPAPHADEHHGAPHE